MTFLVDFIIPTFGDTRVIDAIKSIKNHKCSDSFRIIVKDGCNKKSYINFVLKHLREWDIIISNRDKGIFDALNTGLDLVNAQWVGWLGADDYLSSEFSSSYLRKTSMSAVSFCTLFVNNESKIIRTYKPCKSRKLRKLGFHLPHFSTFIRSNKLTNHRFNLKYGIVSDILFFIFLEQKKLDVKIYRNVVSTYMLAGGTSNKSFKRIIQNNWKLIKFLKEFKYSNLECYLFIFNKILYKIMQIKIL